MTGFAGLFSLEPLDRDASDELLAVMAGDIRYASQDLVEYWRGGHLAVTRVHHGLLNPEPQPIFNEDGSLGIIMDGEVFDYDRERRSLRGKGHRFRFEENDAEYCLHLYEEYGAEAFAKLNGSYALMLFNRGNGELLLVNDRVASYPIYYWLDLKQVAFGTQLRPLLRNRRLPRGLDLRTVFEFFALGRVLGDHTFYQDVKALPPATILHLRGGEPTLTRYWIPKCGSHPEPAKHYAEALTHGVRQAVERKTRGDHRFGLLLSGGLDSRMVVASSDRPLTAFTLGEFENREVNIARRVARAAGVEHVFLRRGFDHYPDLVDEAVAIGDGMQRFDHALVLGTLNQIRERCDVVFDAFGFDARLKGLWAIEKSVVLLGRRFHVPQLLEIRDVGSTETWEEVRSFRQLPVFSELFRMPYKETARDAVLASLAEALQACPGRDPQDQIAYPMTSSFRSIGGYLMVQATRAHIAQRSIVFDNDLLDLSLSIPAELRARGRVLKKALRHLAPELSAISDANTGLRADLPVWLEWMFVSGRTVLRDSGLLSTPKVPHPAYTQRSWPHWSELIRQNNKLRGMIENTLQDPECLDPDLFDVHVAQDLQKTHLEYKQDSGRLLFLLLTFGRWHKKYGPR